MILGTAGHVDHGKTALVKALTGTDTDRLPEERRRGMTIELGFAHLDLPTIGRVGVIDVPGHERFIKAMAAGAGGVDCVLLVVAADEGVMPQTREHIDICSLLGVQRGVLVVTKADLLPALGDSWLALLEADLRQAVRGTFLEGAPVVEVSAKTSMNLDVLRRTIAQQFEGLAPRRDARGPLFMPVDRAFTTKGFGLVVTGTVLSGVVNADSQVSLLPSLPGPFRVRGVHAHNSSVAQVKAGERAAVNLPELEVANVHRGMVLVLADGLHAAKSLDVELQLLSSSAAPLGRRSRQLISLGTAAPEAIVRLVDLAQLRPGERGFAQLRFSSPVAALVGQHFVLRTASGRTIGGGRVLALDAPRRRAGSTARLTQLASLAPAPRVRALLIDAGYRGRTFVELALATALPAQVLAQVLAGKDEGFVLVETSQQRFLDGSVFQALTERLVHVLDAFHRASPERPGVPAEEVRQRLEVFEPTFLSVLSAAVNAKRVERAGDVLKLPGRGQVVDAAAAALRDELTATLANLKLAPLTPAELARRRGLAEGPVRTALQSLAAQGRVIRAGDFFFDAGAVKALELRLRAAFAQSPKLTTQAFKELVGESRKFSIPLAEYFDRERVTLRVGDVRTLRDAAP